MKKKCEHLEADGWHVATHPGRELVAMQAGSRYGWGEHLRAELSGGVSRWTWPALGALLALGVFIGDLWLMLGAAGALLFFVYQAATLVRTLGSGEVVTSASRELTTVDADGKEPVMRAVTEIKGRRCEVIVTCQQCIESLRAKKDLELAVLVDPVDTGNNWLIGFRDS